MSSSDPIALDDSTFKLDQRQWKPYSERNQSTVRATFRPPLPNDTSRTNHVHATRRSVPSAFSPPGFFTDRALANISTHIMDAGVLARVGYNYEPLAIPRSATQTLEEARLARDSSLEWSVFGEDDGVSFDGTGDTVAQGQMGVDESSRMNRGSNTSSEDQLQLSNRTFRANVVNRHSINPAETGYESLNEGSATIARDGSGDAMLAFSDMIDVEMGQTPSSAQALNNAQRPINQATSKSSSGTTISSSIEYPRSVPRYHLSHDPTDSLSAYEYVHRGSNGTAHSTYSASHQSMRMSETPISGIAVSTPLTHFATTLSTSRTTDSQSFGRAALADRTVMIQAGVRSISRTMVAESSRRGRNENDSTPLTTLEVSPVATTRRNTRSTDQEMHSTPLSDYAAAAPPSNKGRPDHLPVSPIQPIALPAVQMEDEDVSVEYGRRESVSPLQDASRDSASRRSTLSHTDLQAGDPCSVSQDGDQGSDLQEGQSERLEAVSLQDLAGRSDSGESIDNDDVPVIEKRLSGNSMLRLTPDATSVPRPTPLNKPDNRYSRRQLRDVVQGGTRKVGSPSGERQSVSAASQFHNDPSSSKQANLYCAQRCLRPWGIVEDWNEIDRMELSVEYVV
ncbi:hypothetical protein QFC24_003125 [Naganishia onofrii]|uniref:Uncharacterized protein n=1 Tax=Naganishia onofrii TaxID=1851511 RepID=A0ACC2XPZ2_9TREE|nr:hypothetical protein QFC24_003125 [Naganishia onofrii]